MSAFFKEKISKAANNLEKNLKIKKKGKALNEKLSVPSAKVVLQFWK